ncbi:MAG: hypothetical protein O2960_28935, partial [Verrucomicrobia bacterium]|nr:hypothetical protein [Verrucomicrobiota bacterium]
KVVGILLGGSAEGGLPSFGDAPAPGPVGFSSCSNSVVEYRVIAVFSGEFRICGASIDSVA